MNKIKITECPRDAWQGLHEFVPTEKKVNYLNQLLKVGFDNLDFGSFVSPKAIPQMADVKDVLSKLDLDGSSTKLLCIVGNQRGAQEAALEDKIHTIGYPFSVSETFQKRNINKGREESLDDLKAILDHCEKGNKELRVYLSMAFGNPYDDEYSPEILNAWVDRLLAIGIKVFAPSDTVGKATPEEITMVYSSLKSAFPEQDFVAHLHMRPENSFSLLEAAISGGCNSFDSALLGFGGCPMAKDELVGNLDTFQLLAFLRIKQLEHSIDFSQLDIARSLASDIFVSKIS